MQFALVGALRKGYLLEGRNWRGEVHPRTAAALARRGLLVWRDVDGVDRWYLTDTGRQLATSDDPYMEHARETMLYLWDEATERIDTAPPCDCKLCSTPPPERPTVH
jgi:hypothetical protein